MTEQPSIEAQTLARRLTFVGRMGLDELDGFASGLRITGETPGPLLAEAIARRRAELTKGRKQ